MERISVFLDDYRRPPNGYVLVKTIDECIYLLENFKINHLSLDHDLLDKYRNGLMLAHIMVKETLFPERITIHSANSVGGKAMYALLMKAQEDSIVPKRIIISLKPLPLHSYSPRVLQHYLDTI